jgi:CheY-like chemotaxis protein
VNNILKSTYEIRIATSGEKALKMADQSPAPDLILLDVMMPEMDGYEVCSRLKSATDTRDIPVIFLTGQTEADDETKGFAVRAVDYIHKPFSPAVVKARVHTPRAPRHAGTIGRLRILRLGFLQAQIAAVSAGRPTRRNRSWKRGLSRKPSMLGST